MIISGGAKGIDTIAEKYAKEHDIKTHIYNPESWGIPALMARNMKIAKACDVLLAIPSKNSKGTYRTIKMAQDLGKKVYVLENFLND